MAALPSGEDGPGAADPALSNAATQGSTTNGRAPKASGRVGTIGAGTSSPFTQGASPAQIRLYAGSDGNLYALDNNSGLAYAVPTTATIPRPPVYSPTK